MKNIKFKSKEGVEYIVNDESVERLFTAQDIYNMRKNYNDEVLHVFGYSGKEILKLIEDHEQRKNNKMTRKEALKKVNKGEYGSIIVDSLEALGLIKFEEDDLVPVMYTSIPRKIYERYTAAIEEIEKAGYKIVKT